MFNNKGGNYFSDILAQIECFNYDLPNYII